MLENYLTVQHITCGKFFSLFIFFPCPEGAQEKKNCNLQNVCLLLQNHRIRCVYCTMHSALKVFYLVDLEIFSQK